MITLELLGLDHSSLCSQLRECNVSRQKEMKKNETNVTGEKLLKPGIKELELTESRRRKTHQQMRNVLGSDLEEIWSRADGGRKREVPKVDMALVSIDDS